MTRFFGVSLLAIGLLSWLARNTTDAVARRAIMAAFLVSDAAGVIVATAGTLSGAMSSLGWSVVAIYLALALGFVYFEIAKPATP